MDLQLTLNYSTEGMNHHYFWRQIFCEKTSREAFGRGGPHTECGTVWDLSVKTLVPSSIDHLSPGEPSLSSSFQSRLFHDSQKHLLSRDHCCRPAPPPASPEAAHGKVHPMLPRAPWGAFHHLHFSCICSNSLSERGGQS